MKKPTCEICKMHKHMLPMWESSYEDYKQKLIAAQKKYIKDNKGLRYFLPEWMQKRQLKLLRGEISLLQNYLDYYELLIHLCYSATKKEK